MIHNRYSLIWLLLVLFGAMSLSLFVDHNGIVSEMHALNQQIIWDIRLPRMLTALVSGGALALSGVLLQTLLRNPLADPYVLGVSGGGSVAALLSILLGLSGVWVILGAFSGALLSIVLVFFLANNSSQGFAFRLILSGVVLASAWGALVSFILTISPSHQLPGMLFWLMGDLSNLQIPWLIIGILLLGFVLCMGLAKAMNVLLHGEIMAQTLGLSVKHLQWFLLVMSSLLVASVISVVGNIGFVGLVVPHIARLLGARDHRQLIPTAILLGAIMLLLADWLSRVIFAPILLPVGILTTFIGAPLFIYLLRKTRV